MRDLGTLEQLRVGLAGDAVGIEIEAGQCSGDAVRIDAGGGEQLFERDGALLACFVVAPRPASLMRPRRRPEGVRRRSALSMRR